MKRYIELEGGLRDAVSFDAKRGRDFQNVAFLAYCCEGVPNEERIPSAGSIENWLVAEDVPSNSLKRGVDLALREFRALAGDSKFNALQKSKRIAPVEFVFIGTSTLFNLTNCELMNGTGVLLYHLAKDTKETQAKAICTLLETIRAEYVDVRTNSKVCKSLWQHVGTLVDSPEKDIVLKQPKAVAKKAATSTKRKHQSDDEDDKGVGSSTKAKSMTRVAKKSTGKGRSQ